MTKPSKKEPRLSLFAGGLPGLARARPDAADAPRAKKVARPPVKRARVAGDELLDARASSRLVDELQSAIKRKPTSEVRLAGVVRALGPLSADLRAELLSAGETLVRRRTIGRELWSAIVRTLAEDDHPGLDGLLDPALAEDEGGGPATLSAAGLSSSPELRARLAKLASGSKPFVAFAAEIGRVVRGDSPGAHLLHLAPIIKEAHRVALASSIVAPLVRGLALSRKSRRSRFAAGAGERLEPGFAVLRSAERHLGRWLLFGEAVVLAGDVRPLAEARSKSKDGPESSRGAWSLVAWALEAGALEAGTLTVGTRAESAAPRLAATTPTPVARPTTELSARLSDRPSADRDLSFLFRMGDAGVPSAKPMLESLTRGPLTEESHLRAAAVLARAFGRAELLEPLRAAATTSREELRGLAIAALHDAGDANAAKDLAEEAVASKHLPTVAWGAHVLANGALEGRGDARSDRGPVVTEALVRHLQWGAFE